MKTWMKVLIGTFIAAVLVCYGGLSYFLGRIQRISPADSTRVVTDSELIRSETPATAVDLSKVDKDIVDDKGVSNILLIGEDQQSAGTTEHRSDSMILASINHETNQITLVSFMRDMYIDIPGYKDNRINAAYELGGTQLLDKTIERNFGIPIDANIVMGFDGFVKALDVLGPIEIRLSEDEARYLNSDESHNPLPKDDPLYGKFHAGANTLQATELLAYARMRHLGQSDYDRTARQRKLITTVFDKARGMSLIHLFGLANEALPYVQTDMTNAEILGYIYAIVSRKMTIGGTYRVPQDGTFREKQIHGADMLSVDYDANAALLHTWLYGETAAAED